MCWWTSTGSCVRTIRDRKELVQDYGQAVESMIRLCEAIARANCRHEITPAFVREAYSLLRQSIIHVEKDDIDFDEEEEEEQQRLAQQQKREAGTPATAAAQPSSSLGAMDEDSMDPNAESMGQSSSAHGTSAGGASGDPASSAASRRKIRITFDRYMEIANLIVLRVNEIERQTMQGVHRSALVDWYLLQRENEIDTVDQFEEETELIKKVLTKLVKDSMLLELREQLDEEGTPSVA